MQSFKQDNGGGTFEEFQLRVRTMVMVEPDNVNPNKRWVRYLIKRSALKAALRKKEAEVKLAYFVQDDHEADPEQDQYYVDVTSRRDGLQIGCKLFDRKNSALIRAWAKESR